LVYLLHAMKFIDVLNHLPIEDLILWLDLKSISSLLQSSKRVGEAVKVYSRCSVRISLNVEYTFTLERSFINWLGLIYSSVVEVELLGKCLKKRREKLSDAVGLLAKTYPALEVIKHGSEDETKYIILRSATKMLSFHCHKLRQLDFDLGELEADDVVDFARSCCLLENLTLQGSAVDGWTINTILNYCQNLKSVDLSFGMQINSAVVETVARVLGSKLETLHVMGCWNGLDDSALWALARYCPNLEAINLFEIESITDEGISMLCQHCTSLSDVDVGSCLQLTDACFRSLSQLPALKRLSCFSSHISHEGLKALCQSATSLIELDLSACKNLTDACFVALLPDAVFSSSLQELEISETLISDESISNILDSYTGLIALRLSGCCNIKSEIITIIAEHQVKCRRRGSAELQEIDINYCKNIPTELQESNDLLGGVCCHSFKDFNRNRIII
jgi:hypothetical protein